jgi:N-acetylmuramic acid 6-phosphate etherase
MTNTLPKTELIYPNADFVDELSTLNAIKLMIDDQINGLNEIYSNLENLVRIVENMYDHLKKYNGRIVYCGAGTSGRIGVQDGVELYPTFGWPLNKIDFLLAGGNASLLQSIEKAEDNSKIARDDFFEKNISEKDIVIGLAASGNTNYTLTILKEAFNQNAFTIAISNNPSGKILKFGKHKIILNTKQEIIAGSTRLKAGTTQKVCLNIISSMVMIKMGKVKKGQMINLIPTNKKLINRKKNIDKFFKS